MVKSKHMAKSKYTVHRGFIAHNRKTQVLYAAEVQRDKDIESAALELAKVLGLDRKRFWTDALPTQLFSILEAWDRQASIAAATEYLRQHDYTVTSPREEKQNVSE